MAKKGTKPSPATIAARKAQSADWDSVDWTLDNRTIATQLGRAYDTVAKKRVKLGKVGMAINRAPRRMLRDSYPNLARHDGKGQAAAVAAAKVSTIAGRTETNCHAKKWELTDPNGKVYKCTNLQHFVRNHPQLFAAADVEFRRTSGKRDTGGEYCNATNGLQYAARTGGTWKKWKAKKI